MPTLAQPSPMMLQLSSAEMAQARVDGEQARMAAELARMQAQLAREQAKAVREAARAAQGSGVFVTTVPPFGGLTRREEGMLFTGFLALVLAAVVVLNPLFRALGRRMERLPRAAGDDAERLQRIEHAVEAMAIEIERISEGQRFTTRLLAERAGDEVPVPR